MSQIQKFEEKIKGITSVKELFSIPDVTSRFIKNYQAVTGRADGENRMEQERFAYLQLLMDKPDLKNVDNYYHVAALIYAGTTGLSFRDNKLYVIPSGKGLKVQPSPAGRREMIEMMPNVKSCPQAVLVMKGDKFVHDKANNRVIEHLTTDKSEERQTLDNIRAAYQRINYKDGTYVDTVVYHDDLVKAKSKSKVKSETSFWNEWPGPACEKVATNRAFRLYHKYPDNVVVYGNPDPDEETRDVDYTPMAEGPVDESTGEVLTPDVKAEKQQSPLPTKEEGESFM